MLAGVEPRSADGLWRVRRIGSARTTAESAHWIRARIVEVPHELPCGRRTGRTADRTQANFGRHAMNFFPNALTCLNLLLGFAAIISASRGEISLATTLVFVGVALDMLDGYLARRLK